MIKIYCDRCGKEIKSFFSKEISKEYLEKVVDKYDLCPDCYKEFQDWRLNKRSKGTNGKR